MQNQLIHSCSKSQNYTAVSNGGYTSTAILTTRTGKMRCTLWDRKHYLTVGTYHALKIGADHLKVLVANERGKNERWKFRIIGAEKVD